MTAINENGQVYFTFEELDLYKEYQNVYQESQKCLDLSKEIDWNSLTLIQRNHKFTFTQEYRDLRIKSHELYKRHILLDQVSDLIYALWIREGDNNA